ncbi:Zinc finger, RING-type [Sesbania bispinosa]|nr:Zinc finger, RING-type [Sesbania bispinosa]
MGSEDKDGEQQSLGIGLKAPTEKTSNSPSYQITFKLPPIDVSLVEPPNSGLHPLIIASLPKLLYNQTDHFRQCEEGATECSVCLATILEDATIRLLPNCKHIFHVDCVDKWFSSNTTCPICRTVAEPRLQVQPTAPPVDDEPQDGSELEKVGCSGLRKGSFHRMVSGRERSLRRTQSSHESIEDTERH